MAGSSKSSGGEGIRTLDLLNAIQETTQPNLLPQRDDAASPPTACTTACTSSLENSKNTLPLEDLATVLVSLSPEDRTRLAVLLAGKQPQTREGKNES